MNREQAKKLVADLVGMSKADEVSISIDGGSTTHLRFARNNPSTSGAFSELEVSIRSSFGSRSAAATVNQTDEATLRKGVRRSEEMARLAPEDPEHMPGLGPTEYAPVDAFDSRTAERGGADIAAGAARCIDEAGKDGLVAAGFTRTRAGFSCIGNSSGMFGYHRATAAYVAETVRTVDNRGSGWGSSSAHAIESVDFAAVSAAAREKARASADPKPLTPGKYVAILEPACVANLIAFMGWTMDARSADEGRSFFSAADGGNRIGEKLFPETITIRSDPTSRIAPGTPWGRGGVPQRARPLVERGVLESLRYSRYWAKKKGVEPVPRPANVLMEGGTGSVADLVASTERGVLITSLWYIRMLDPRTLTFTGLTRDGVFWIEDGKIAHPVTNFRWNDSPIAVLKNTVAMSAPMRTPPRPSRATNVVVPAVKVSEFNLASVSDAV